MKRKEQLFYLVKSLTPAEIKFFNTEHSGNTSSYMKLFSEVLKQDVYEESVLKLKIQGSKQFHTLKNYLKREILSSLRRFYSYNNAKQTVYTLLKEIDILLGKELYEMALENIKRCKKIALENELLSLELEVISYEKKIHQNINVRNDFNLEQVLDNEKESIHKLKISNELSQAISLSTNNHNVQGLSYKEFADLEFNTIEQIVLFHHLKYHQVVMEGKSDVAKETLENLVEILLSKEQFIKNNPRYYISTVNNLLGFLLFTKDYDQALKTIYQLRTNIKDWSIDYKQKSMLRMILRVNNIELELYRDLKMFDDTKISEIKKFVKTYETIMPIDYKLMIWYQIGNINFLQGNYKVANMWINELLGIKGKERKDIQLHARILNLLIHFSLNNSFVLGYHIDSFKRYVRLYWSQELWLDDVCDLFSDLRKSDEDDYDNIIKIFLNKTEKNAHEFSDFLDYIDLNYWYQNIYCR
ncbi:MAG: hypothetical protein MRY83_24265 [Flavobacteriales bacterium]|nr:hypothetical protein [Flavobacteriales bacterium]